VIERLQRIGGFLAAMVIPNIAAFIAWGLITALFIPTGWIPSPRFAELVAPMIRFLLPLLIGYTGGKLVYDQRGGVVGALATVGVAVGADTPMLLGGMIMGPLGGWLIKRLDQALEERIPSGFEMLVSNFAAGILGAALVLAGMVAVGPAVQALNSRLGAGVAFLVERRLLPLVDLIIAPAKVVFLNNAINHGILVPAGAAEAARSGRAIHFLLESNPGPGLGLLAAYWAAGRGLLKESAPGAAVVHFLGGIHEVYFPYVIAHPVMLAAMWAGGISADFWFVVFKAGLVAPPSPGSIFAYLAVTPKGMHVAVLGGVLLGAFATFVVGSLILRSFPVKEASDNGKGAPLIRPGGATA
jgi:mannitol PTS system EIICBA or EIICB component